MKPPQKDVPKAALYIFKTPFLRAILLSSLAVSAVFPLYILFWVMSSLTQLMIDSTSEDALRVARYMVSMGIDAGLDFSGEIKNPRFLSMLSKFQRDFKLEKVKIFSPEGEVIYSSDPKDIGARNVKPYFRDIVAKGRTFSKLVRRHERSLEDRLLKEDVVETYVPLMRGGVFRGAFEIYYDITKRKRRLFHILNYSYATMGLLFAILMGGIFLALFKASRTLLEREQAQEELRAYKEHLEEMVAARTAELEAANTRYRKQVVETLQAQEALRESEERFRKLGESAKDAIIIMDVDGRISFWNKAAQGMFKYRPDEVLGQDLHQLLAPERYREQFQMCFREFKAAGEDRPLAKTMELWALRSDGKEFPVELSLSRMKVKGQWETIGIVRDISERKRAEEERNKLQEQLWRSQKMEALGTLAGGIAHDFNNILAAIIGYAELAMIDVPESSVQHSYLKSVVKAGYRAKDLVQQILSFTRQDHPEKRLITMVPLVKEILKLLRASLPKNIEISLSVQEGSSTVLADATQMHQVLMNLCTNAAHAMQEKGGKLHIQLSRVVIRDGGSIPGVSLSAGPYLQLRVQDTGHGMTPEVMERIFDPYFTTKKRGEGTGLGLSVVQGIVQGHGGAIRVQSQVGVGSTFDIFLPLVEDTPELRDTWEFDSLPKGKETILLVDDEETVLDVSRRMLERLGYCVEPRTDAEEALEMFRAEPGRFSLVISDLIMPTMTGDQLIGEIRRIRPDIPVILISGGAARMRVSTGNPEKADAILRKPLVMKELAEAVHRLLSQSGTRSAPTS